MIKPIEKSKIKRTQTVKYWRNKADKKFQEIGRETYDSCLVCGGEYSCLHHFWPKSQTTFLRYNIKNGIPICQKCHFFHHNGDPEIHVRIIEIKGQDWYDKLKNLRDTNRYVSAGYKYYENMYNKLCLINK